MSTNSPANLPERHDGHYVEEYTRQLILNPDCDWKKLLDAAPSTLVCLGQAFVVASSGIAIQIERTNLLQYTSLRANLQECVDLGQEAFLEAEGSMKQLRLVANIITAAGGAIDKILRLCNHESVARRDLPSQIERLKALSKDCVDGTKLVQQKFATWAKFTRAVKAGCTQADDNAKEESHQLDNQKVEQDRKTNRQEQELKDAKDRMERHRKILERHAKDVDAAQAKIPKGSGALAIRAGDAVMNGVGTLAEGASHAFSAIVDLVAAGGPSLNLRMTSNPPPKPTQQKTRNARNTVKQLRKNWESSKEAFLESQKQYYQLEKEDKQAKDEFNDIQLELQRLERGEMDTKKVLEILSKCIDNLTTFQHRVTELERFFTGVYNYVSVIDKTYVTEFVHSAKQIASADPSKKEEHEEQVAYYLKEIRFDALNVRGSYTAVGELADAYVQISERHILPGVTQVNRLLSTSLQQASSQVSIADKIKQINTYARRAQSDASRIADQRRKKIQDQLYDKERIIDEAGAILEGYEAEEGDHEEDEEEDGNEGQEEQEEGDEWDDDDGVDHLDDTIGPAEDE